MHVSLSTTIRELSALPYPLLQTVTKLANSCHRLTKAQHSVLPTKFFHVCYT